MWLHLAVVLDGNAKRVSHYLNGQTGERKGRSRSARLFASALRNWGNWNGRGFPENDPFMIRNFSGAMDDFCLFSRALPAAEILRHCIPAIIRHASAGTPAKRFKSK
jgi:hypothetical protein